MQVPLAVYYREVGCISAVIIRASSTDYSRMSGFFLDYMLFDAKLLPSHLFSIHFVLECELSGFELAKFRWL